MFISNQGYCYTCDQEVTFASYDAGLRDHYVCSNCNSIPRERALMHCIEKFYPNWRDLHIHESSPANRGASVKLKASCSHYKDTQCFPNLPLGDWNQDLENQTFQDESFDLVITQDVMEHIFNPAKAFSEIARTLKPGGAHIFTVGLVTKENPSEICAQKNIDGTITHFKEPEYHGNPISSEGSLVTVNWGYDIADFVLKHSGLYTTIAYIDDISHGIRAEYIEVLISRKLKL